MRESGGRDGFLLILFEELYRGASYGRMGSRPWVNM